MSERLITVKDFILFDLRGSGPKTFSQIGKWIREQHSASTPDWAIAKAINELIRANRVYLYDTGDAFDSCEEE